MRVTIKHPNARAETQEFANDAAAFEWVNANAEHGTHIRAETQTPAQEYAVWEYEGQRCITYTELKGRGTLIADGLSYETAFALAGGES